LHREWHYYRAHTLAAHHSFKLRTQLIVVSIADLELQQQCVDIQQCHCATELFPLCAALYRPLELPIDFQQRHCSGILSIYAALYWTVKLPSSDWLFVKLDTSRPCWLQQLLKRHDPKLQHDIPFLLACF
jgi:hypothetical protein